MKSVGIDIGSNSIKVVEVMSTSRGLHVANYLIHPLTKTEASDQEIEIIEFLRGLPTRYDLATTRLNFAIRQDRVAIRNKIFPFNERLKIAKSLAFELEEDIPFSSETAIFDAKIVQYHGNATEVLACAVPKHHVESLLQILKDGGVQPSLVSTEAPAVANIFERWDDTPPQNPPLPAEGEESTSLPARPISIVLEIGHSRTLVCAFERNQMVGTRSIMWGGKQIIDSIAKKYNLPPREAQKEMELKAFILTHGQDQNYEAKIFSDLIAQCVRDMARDLQLVLLEFKAEFNGFIQKIDMTGGVSMIQGLGPFLTQLIEVPVNRLATLDPFHAGFEKNDTTHSRLAVALGLAIEGLKKPRNPAVNFLKGEFAAQSNFAHIFWQKWGKTVQWTAACLFVLFIWSVTRSFFAEDLKSAAQENLKQQAKNVAGLTGRNASENRIREHINSSSRRAEELRRLTGLARMNSAMDVMKKINDSLPSRDVVPLEVRILSISDNSVVMEGYVNNTQQVSILQRALNGLATDGRVQSRRSRLGPWDRKTTFAFTFSVDREIQKGAAR